MWKTNLSLDNNLANLLSFDGNFSVEEVLLTMVLTFHFGLVTSLRWLTIWVIIWMGDTWLCITEVIFIYDLSFYGCLGVDEDAKSILQFKILRLVSIFIMVLIGLLCYVYWGGLAE
nr:hypothetical protein [Tanacetum cinerariifolium]